MAPIHHHFELAGWPEFTVIVRFWIMAGPVSALALGALLRRLPGRAGDGVSGRRGSRVSARSSVGRRRRPSPPRGAPCRRAPTSGSSDARTGWCDSASKSSAAPAVDDAGRRASPGAPGRRDVVVTEPGCPGERAGPAVGAATATSPCRAEIELGARLCVACPLRRGHRHERQDHDDRARRRDAAGVGRRGRGVRQHRTPVLDGGASRTTTCWSVEASSFQLRFTETFHPGVGAAEPGARPPGLARVVRRVRRREGADVRAAGPGRRARRQRRRRTAAASVSRRRAVPSAVVPRGRTAGTGEVGVRRNGCRAVCRERPAGRPPATPAPAFRADAAAAAAASLAFGARADAVIAEGSTSFAPLPHRGEIVATRRRRPVRRQLEGDEPARGARRARGRARRRADRRAGGPRASTCRRSRGPMPSLAGVVAIGEAAPRGRRGVRRAWCRSARRRHRWRTRSARRSTLRAAGTGTVLLAPACASRDMFRDYAERGEAFASAARALAGDANATGTTNGTTNGPSHDHSEREGAARGQP